jgi:hypothetical protein
LAAKGASLAQPIEPDEDQAICSAQPEPYWRGPLQDDKLLAEKCRFGLASRMRSEQSDEQSAEQLQEVKHPKARIAHRGICASPDTIFGSHRQLRTRSSTICHANSAWRSARTTLVSHCNGIAVQAGSKTAISAGFCRTPARNPSIRL